jgi:PKD repeat protein
MAGRQEGMAAMPGVTGRGRRTLRGLVVLATLAAAGLWVSPPAGAVAHAVGTHAAATIAAAQPDAVSPVPDATTPDVNDGTVYALAQVGDDIYAGGSFATVSPPTDPPGGTATTSYPLANLFRFDSTTGAIDGTSFLPVINGEVDSITAGPAANEIYVAGDFTTVDGLSMHIALLDATTGALIPSWSPSSMDDSSRTFKVVLSGGRLFAAGTFTTVGGQAHNGLVALDPTTGQVTSYVGLSFTGNHNFGVNCQQSDPAGCAEASPGVRSVAINPAGTEMVAIGNFTSVSGVSRDQIARINLGASAATLEPDWQTLAFTAACFDNLYDSYIRSVQFSPDGSFFIVTASGGIGTNTDTTQSSCDSASRYETNGTGTNVRPTWIDYTGEDSLWTSAVTDSVVYVGGHERWLNNSLGQNVAGPGAVPRPGVAVLSATNGLPLAWNPGRNPRGAGCFALLLTPTGLYLGSDTTFIGPGEYFRARLAFFPLAGGETLPTEATPQGPGRVYLVGAVSPTSDRFASREFDGTTVGTEQAEDSAGIDWSTVHGAFDLDGEVIYGKSDGSLDERTFDGTTFGPEVTLDPYDDPTWDDVGTGSGQTYQGVASNFSAELSSTSAPVTSMFFSNGRLFYTLAGDSSLYWRWFELDSGVVGSAEFTVSSPTDFSDVAGAFLSGDQLYYADQTDGELHAVGWTGSAPTGDSVVVDTSTDWASDGLFLLSSTTNPTPTPTAAFTATCSASGPTCSYTATPWTDPDGGNVSYAWTFGDGGSQPASTATNAVHTYNGSGTFSVGLTVTTTSGESATVTHSVTAEVAAPPPVSPPPTTKPPATIGFVGTSRATSASKKLRVVVPAKTAAGEQLLLFESYAGQASITAPTGWTSLAAKRRHDGLTEVVYHRIATKSDAGRTFRLITSRAVHATAVLAVYRHASPVPIEASADHVGGAGKSLAAPHLHRLSAGSWVIGFWAQRATTTPAWTAPSGANRRTVVHSVSRPSDGALLVDTGGPRSGTVALGTAKTRKPGTSSAAWVIALAPAAS